MKKIFIWSLVFVLGVSLIGMFGCTSGQAKDRKGNVYWGYPGESRCLTTLDKSTVKKVGDFTYCVEEREEYGKTYYTNNEPVVDPATNNLVLKDIYEKWRNSNKIYDRETLEFLGYPCDHWLEVEITSPYRKFTQK